MASHDNLNDILISHPKDIIDNIFSRLSVKDLLRSRSVSKSWLSLISSPDFVKTHDLIMYNIFSRLTVKDLLRLKSVCKSWLSLISSRDFINTHLSISTHDPHFTHHRLVLSDSDVSVDGPENVHKLNTCSVYSLLHEPFTERLVDFDVSAGLLNELLDEPVAETFNHNDIKKVVGCCNGLVCLGDYVDLFFWNPCTRKSRRLPKLDMVSPEYTYVSYGFCYDESNDDFKVFAIFDRPPPRECNFKVSVYSSKSDSWRLIGNFPFSVIGYVGHFSNGAIYWAVLGCIVSLDIKTEAYQEVSLPNYREGEYYWNLGTFGGNLSLLCKFGQADFWVYGVEESWTKLFTISYNNIDEFLNKYWYIYPKPICKSVNGDILLNLDSTIVLYNAKDNTLKGLLGSFFQQLQVCTYVESLVSPHL